MWNLQSGQERKTFTVPRPAGARPDDDESARLVRGIVSDSLNKNMVVGSGDGVLTVRHLLTLGGKFERSFDLSFASLCFSSSISTPLKRSLS